MKNLPLLTLIALCCACPPPASGAEVDLGGYLHQVTRQRDTLRVRTRQWVYPVRVRQPLPGGELDIQTALMRIEQSDTASVDIWSLLDTRLTGRWRLGRKALLSLTAGLPTGKRALDGVRADLARSLARNDLNFPVKTFGEGVNLGGGFSFAHQMGRYGLSLGLGYLQRGAYEPVKGMDNYRPGAETSLTLGLDYTHGRTTYRLSGVGTFYLTDRLDGLAVFQHAKQVLIQAGVYHNGRTFQVDAELIEIARLKNRRLDPDGRFLYEARDSNGNDLRARLEITWTPAPAVALFVRSDLKHLTANAYPSDNPLHQGRAHLWGGGGGLSLTFGGEGRLVLRALRWDGEAEDGTVQLEAFNLRASLTFPF